jgi:GABA(A) receptor-associated protein
MPVILSKQKESSLPNLDRYKYLVPEDLSVYHFQYIIRKRLKLTANEALFFFVTYNGISTLLKSDSLFGDVYKLYARNDGFLYISMTEEKAFGDNTTV